MYMVCIGVYKKMKMAHKPISIHVIFIRDRDAVNLNNEIYQSQTKTFHETSED